ncbi:MAG TPA: hypothetical protein VJ761_10030 [Ktedonobacteraceae bacterium]|nr:hypothetical protein [Ktedonobacteraceae bacterium]
MKTVRTFAITLAFALMFIVPSLTTAASVHAVTRQVSSPLATRQFSCGNVPLTFPFYSNNSPYGLELTRHSDGTAFLLAVTTTPDEYRLGIGELYVWIKLAGQNQFAFWTNEALSTRIPDRMSDFLVIMASFGPYQPEAVFNSCEWASLFVTIHFH